MAEHPIQGLMKTAMENIKEMVDVNTIIGDSVETPDGTVIIPVSKVGFGFAAGGSEFTTRAHENHQPNVGSGDQHKSPDVKREYPFGGGSGGGVSITPVAFIVVGEKGVRLLSTEKPSHLYDRLIELAPQLMEKFPGLKRKKDTCTTPSEEVKKDLY